MSNTAVLNAVLVDGISNVAGNVTINLGRMEAAGDAVSTKFLELNAIMELSSRAFEAIQEITDSVIESLTRIQDASQVWQLKDGEEGKRRLKDIVEELKNVGLSSKEAYEIATKLGREYNTKGAAQLAQVIEAVKGNLQLSGKEAVELTGKIVTLGERSTVGAMQIRKLGESFGPGISAAAEISKVTGRSIEAVNAQLKAKTLPTMDLINALAQAQLDFGKQSTLAGAAASATANDVGTQWQRLLNTFTDFKDNFAEALFGGGPEAAKTIAGINDSIKDLLKSQRVVDFLHNIGAGFQSFIAPGGGAEKAIKAVSSAVSDAIAVFNFFAEHKEILIASLAGIAAVVLTTVVPAFLVWAGATIAATWPLLAIGAAVGALVYVFLKWGPQIMDAVDGVWNGAKIVFSNLLDFFKGLGSSLFQAGADLVNGFVDGIKSLINHPIDAIKEMGLGVVSAFKSILGIHSPSLVFQQQGIEVPEGAAQGVKQGTPRAVTAVHEMGQAVTEANEGKSTSVPLLNNPRGSGGFAVGTSTGATVNEFNFAGIEINVHGASETQGNDLKQGDLKEQIKEEIMRGVMLMFSRAGAVQ